MTFFYKKVEGKEKAKYFKSIVDFYNRYFPEGSNKKIAKNSTVFWVVRKDKEIIGVTRVLTDYSRYALILDLIVKKKERNQGVGRNLVSLVTEYCSKKNIKHLILTTDPRYYWLTNFYKKSGFKKITNQLLMEFDG